jgi:hypothetical protein
MMVDVLNIALGFQEDFEMAVTKVLKKTDEKNESLRQLFR